MAQGSVILECWVLKLRRMGNHLKTSEKKARHHSSCFPGGNTAVYITYLREAELESGFRS